MKYYLAAVARKSPKYPNGKRWFFQWQNIPGYTGENPYDLNEIIGFTTQFRNQDDLKSFLIKHSYDVEINNDQLRYPLTITYYHKNQWYKLAEGHIPYQSDLEFINYDFIRNYLWAAIVIGDIKLLKDIAFANQSNPYARAMYVTAVNIQTGVSIKFGSVKNMITNFINREVGVFAYNPDILRYELKKDDNNKTKINYNRLIVWGMALSKYNKKKVAQTTVIEEDQLEESPAHKIAQLSIFDNIPKK